MVDISATDKSYYYHYIHHNCIPSKYYTNPHSVLFCYHSQKNKSKIFQFNILIIFNVWQYSIIKSGVYLSISWSQLSLSFIMLIMANILLSPHTWSSPRIVRDTPTLIKFITLYSSQINILLSWVTLKTKGDFQS